MLKESNTKQVSLEVLLKKETNNKFKTETENTFDDVNLENLILALNTNMDSAKYDKTNDPFDKQLQDLIKQLEEECKEVNAIGNKRHEKDQQDSTREFIGKAQTKISRSIKQEVHVKEETDIRNESEMPRKRTNSEVAEHKAKASNALKDLKRAEIEVHMLR